MKSAGEILFDVKPARRKSPRALFWKFIN